MDLWSGSALLVAAAVLVSAAVSDVRTRRVDDRHWLFMLCACVPLASASVAEVHGASTALLYLAGSALMGLYVLSPRVSGARAVPVLALSAAAFLWPAASGSSGGAACASALVSCLLFAGMHGARLLAGGADAKCLMSLALAVPEYPNLPGLPLLSYPEPLPPALAVLVLALLISAAWGVRAAVSNARAGRLGRGMFSYVRVPLAEADPVRHWPAERAEGGGIVPCRPSPEGSETILEGLRAAGAVDVKVAVTVPFILPVCLALPLLLAVGLPVA